MHRLFLLLFSFFLFNACKNSATTHNQAPAYDTAINKQDTAATANKIIADTAGTTANASLIAGESVGKISLGMDASHLQNILGSPDKSDAAMGKAWLFWYGKRDEHNNKTELDIYTTYKDSSMRQKTVQQIRTTSSFFITPDSIHVYSSLADIKSKYVLSKAGEYTSEGRTIIIYDDKQQGIAFEIATANAQHICTGIIVHSKNKSVNDIYIMLHPDMKRLDK